MGWFHDKYGKNAEPKIPIKDFLYIADHFGEDAAIETECDVQDGKISVETLEKYLYKRKRD